MAEAAHPPARGPPWHPDPARTGEGACVHRADLHKVSSLPVLPHGCISLPMDGPLHGPRRGFSMHDSAPEGSAHVEQR